MQLQLKELLSRNISEMGVPQRAIHCPPGTTVQAAVQILKREQIGSVVILADKVVKGIFTERDFLEKVAFQGVDISKATVDGYMTPNPVCVKRPDTIGQVLTKMREGKFRHVIVVDSYGHLEKVVSLREIMSYLMDALVGKVE